MKQSFLAIVFALEMSLQQDWLREMEIIIETDSKIAPAWINKEEEGPWNWRFHCNKLRNILLVLKNVIFTHRNREANYVADSLTKKKIRD